MIIHKLRRLISVVLLGSLTAAMSFFTGCGIHITTGLGKDAANYTAGGASIGDKVESLDIQWASDRIEIIGDDVDSIIIEEEDKNLPEDQKAQWWLDGSTLRIRFAKANVFGYANKKIKITVPREAEFKDCNVSVASAELIIENINAQNLNLDSASGSISGRGLNAHNTKLDSASGRIEIRDSSLANIKGNSASGKMIISVSGCKEAVLSSASGGVDLDFADMPEKIKVNTASGSVKAALPENADFTADVDTASGSVRFDIPTISADGKYVAGDGKNSIEIDTASGSVHVKNRTLSK